MSCVVCEALLEELVNCAQRLTEVTTAMAGMSGQEFSAQLAKAQRIRRKCTEIRGEWARHRHTHESEWTS